MAHYQTLLDLKKSTTKANHLINRFHTSSPYGGGWFMWQKGSNVGVTEIPGIVVKPSTGTEGYWIRQEYLNGQPFTPEMFGASCTQSTMLAQGWSQADATACYPGITVTVGTDSADTVAIQAMFNAMFAVSNSTNSQVKTCTFSGRDYFLSKACTIPRFPGTMPDNSPNRMVRFVINGNGARIRPLTTQTFAFFQSEISSAADNENGQADRNITIRDFTFDGASAGSGGTSYCLKLYGGTNNKIEGCHFKGCDYGLWLGFVINNVIDTCFAQGNRDCGYYIGISHGANDSQSNVTKMTMCKSTQYSTATSRGVIVSNSNNVELNGMVFEGSYKYGVELVYTGSTWNTFKISNVHWEAKPGSTLLYNQKVHQVIIDYVESGAPNTVLVESNPSVDVFYYISNIGYVQPGVKFAHRGNPDATSFWFFNNVAAANNTIKDAANWVTTSGYSVPNYTPVQYVNGDTTTRVQRTQVTQNGVLPAGESEKSRVWEGYFGILKTANV